MTKTMAQAIDSFEPSLPLMVAFSGGADSTALLVACHEKWPGKVSAVHINHGIQSGSDDFESHCRSFCIRLKLPLLVRKVDGRHMPGQSPEAAARFARYKAFSSLEQDTCVSPIIKNIAIAHHADDQIETILLALSRGSGLPGLSAMPAFWVKYGISFYRPLLNVCASNIKLWLIERKYTWVEDPTNIDEKFTRNRIRARLLPALEATFPQFRDTFSRSAAHAAQSQSVLDEVAVQDHLVIGSPPLITSIQSFSKARQANVLRFWLRKDFSAVPSAAQMNELLDQISVCTTRGHNIRIKVAQGYVVRKGQHLDWYNR